MREQLTFLETEQVITESPYNLTNLKIKHNILTLNDWKINIKQEFLEQIKQLYATTDVAPKETEIFRAFLLTKPSEVKVVFIGQDPYPTKGVANGLAFSVQGQQKIPASLRNMYQELASDLKIIRQTGDLTKIAEQGVLFLNTVLTVEVGKANSHQKIGWEEVTLQIIKDLDYLKKQRGVIFVLLGKQALKLKSEIIYNQVNIIEAPHPSPLSAYRGFFGSKIYSQINERLIALNLGAVDWSK
ncbi:MAG: uracil-DNA glycosylase [Mycoplasmatales bacterium]